MSHPHVTAPTATTPGVTTADGQGPRLMPVTLRPRSAATTQADAAIYDAHEPSLSAPSLLPAHDVEGSAPPTSRADKDVKAAGPASTRFRVQFPERRETENVIVETPLMTRTATRTLALHYGSPLVVWTGPSRNGKTETAKWLRDNINQASESDPNGFRAVLFEYGGGTAGSKNEMKRVIRSVYQATVAKLDEGLFRQSPSEDLALHVVKGLRAKNIQMLMVDEAGLLKVEGLRALVTIRDVAEHHGWPLSIVLIGMDNLPADIARLPQIARRVHEWCYFEPYVLEETYELLAGLDPQFAKLRLDVPAQRDMIAFIQEISAGLPGLLAPYLRKLHYNQSMLGGPLSLTLLRAVHMLTDKEHQKALGAASTEYKLEGVPSKTKKR
ncbi:MAG TPA: ATP-binding protein [Gemmatimonadaceae bacterium]|nr:ATP-binding protein [Gemmatimonadaceae bacterium]